MTEIHKNEIKVDKNIENKELFWQRLYIDFLKDNAFTFFIYILVVFFIFPTEGVLIPYVLGKLFDKMKIRDFNTDFLNIFSNIKNQNSAGLMIIIGLVWLIVIIADYGKGEIEAYITPKYLQYVRALFFEGTINLHDSGEFKDIKSGAYIARIMELSRNLRDAFQYTFSKFVPECIVSAIIILYLLYSVPTIGGIMMFQVILSLIIMATYGSTLMDLIIKKETFFLDEISDNLQNNFNNLMNVFINNETEETVDKNVKLEKKNEELTNEIMNMENRAILSTQLLTVLAYGISLYYLYDSLKTKQISISLAISIILILGNYLSYVMD